MIIFSHRGLGFGFPENSLESYRRALNEEFSLEIDVQTTKDNFLIISHDLNLNRIYGVDKNISDLTLKEIRAICGEEIMPELEETLRLFKKQGKDGFLAVHFKGNNPRISLKALISLLKKYSLESRAFIFDLSLDSAKWVKSNDITIKVGLSVGEKRYSETIYLWEDIMNSGCFDMIWLDEWHSALYNEKNLSALGKMGKPIYAVSPELHVLDGHPDGKDTDMIKKVWSRLKTLGISGICTDYPRQLRAL